MVERYDPIIKGEFTPVDDGPFVEYADYAALQSENDRLKAERVDLERLREWFCLALQDEFDLEAADPEDPRHDDGRDEALRVSGRLLALIDAQGVMARYLEFAPGEYDGDIADISTISKRRSLVGKRVGYDLSWSCMMHFGTITGATRRGIEIDGGEVDVREITKIVVLRDK